MAPSLGYSKLNDNSPTEIEDIEQTFLSVMKKHGLLIEQTQTQQPENRKQTYNKPRPCILQALKLQLTGPNGHLMRLAIAAEYKRLGYTDQEIIDLFKNQADFDVNTCSVQVASIDAEKTAKCETIKEYGYCLPHC
jgi:DNA primase large subunit